MQPSPLQLEGYFLKKLSFTVDDGLLPQVETSKDVEIGVEVPVEYPPISLAVEPEIRIVDAGEKLWRCDLTVKCGDPRKVKKSELPYSLEVGFVGLIRIAGSIPEDHAEQLVRVNGPALLYSAAREVVLTLTSRSPGPPFLLPSVTFLTPPPDAPAKAPKKRLASGKPDEKTAA